MDPSTHIHFAHIHNTHTHNTAHIPFPASLACPIASSSLPHPQRSHSTQQPHRPLYPARVSRCSCWCCSIAHHTTRHSLMACTALLVGSSSGLVSKVRRREREGGVKGVSIAYGTSEQRDCTRVDSCSSISRPHLLLPLLSAVMSLLMRVLIPGMREGDGGGWPAQDLSLVWCGQVTDRLGSDSFLLLLSHRDVRP